jgi:uncharacterized protein (DUF488 family)
VKNPIYTIGYGGHSQARLMANLERWEVDLLVDVRSWPHSRRRPELGRDELEKMLAARHIDYLWLGAELGGRPTDPACLTEGEVDYDKVRAQTFFRAGITQLLNLRRQHDHIALLCAEADPARCHRALLIAPALEDAMVEVLHILATGTLETQEEMLAREDDGQQLLFDGL